LIFNLFVDRQSYAGSNRKAFNRLCFDVNRLPDRARSSSPRVPFARYVRYDRNFAPIGKRENPRITTRRAANLNQESAQDEPRP
jgi:hypothetical protein